MLLVHPEMLERGGLVAPAVEIDRDFGGRPGFVIVVVVPEENGNTLVVAGRHDVDIGLAAHAMAHDILDIAAIIAFRFQPFAAELAEHAGAVYEYEPDPASILEDLIPRNISVQVFRALLENVAGEMGAKMSAMDNATRNAGEMINKLTLSYNRQRQAQITKELIEIISGAEAL